MRRQRLRVEVSALAAVAGRALVVLLGAALVWYGAMVVLLALKVSPSTVNGLSGYRSAYRYLASLTPGDVSSSDRLVVALVGVVLFLLAGALVWRGRPRPHLARLALVLPDHGRGLTEIAPRVIERVAEAAAVAHPAVLGARARCDDQTVMLAITARDAEATVETLREVRERAHRSLDRHELELTSVDVTLAGHDRKNRRELR